MEGKTKRSATRGALAVTVASAPTRTKYVWALGRARTPRSCHVHRIDAQMEVMVTTYQSIFEGNTLLEHWDFEIPKQYFRHSTALLSSS